MSDKMNDPDWVQSLQRAKTTVKLNFVAVHVAIGLRGPDGIAPVVLQTEDAYVRPPRHLEAAFELCLRHLHGRREKMSDTTMTVNALLSNRAVAALRLPGRFVPTADGAILDMGAPVHADIPNTRPAHEERHWDVANIRDGQPDRVAAVSCQAEPTCVGMNCNADEYAASLIAEIKAIRTTSTHNASDADARDEQCSADAPATTNASLEGADSSSRGAGDDAKLSTRHITRREKRRLKHAERRAAKHR